MICTTEIFDAFLNGFIIYKRGKQDSNEAQPTQVNNKLEHPNNLMLKKIKIALSLKSDDLHQIFDQAGMAISKSELSAVLRKEGHRNYKECGDRYIRNFLKGLTSTYRK